LPIRFIPAWRSTKIQPPNENLKQAQKALPCEWVFFVA